MLVNATELITLYIVFMFFLPKLVSSELFDRNVIQLIQTEMIDWNGNLQFLQVRLDHFSLTIDFVQAAVSYGILKDGQEWLDRYGIWRHFKPVKYQLQRCCCCRSSR